MDKGGWFVTLFARRAGIALGGWYRRAFRLEDSLFSDNSLEQYELEIPLAGTDQRDA